MTHDLADAYQEMVLELTEHIAPFRPWWDVELTPDQQLWRYQEDRAKWMPWLIEVMPYMGWESFEEAIGELEDLWFSVKAEAAVPITLQAMVPAELLRLVQAEPVDAAKHIRRMEHLLESRLEATATLAAAEEVYPEEAPEPPSVVIRPESEVNDVPLTPKRSTGAGTTPPYQSDSSGGMG